MSRLLSIYWLIVLPVVTDMRPVCAEGELIKQFREEAPSAWREYQLLTKQIEGIVNMKVLTTIIKADGKADRPIEESYRMEFKQNSACRMVISQTLSKEDSTGEVIALNRTYAFKLGRKAESAPWALTEVDVINQANSALNKDSITISVHIESLVRAVNYPLWELVELPTFQVTGATVKQQGGERLIEISFDNTHTPTRDRSVVPIQSGVLLLDPNRYWCLRSYSLYLVSPDLKVRYSVDLELEENTAGFPIPKRVVMNSQSSSAGGLKMSVTNTRDFMLRKTDTSRSDDEFTLAAFGLSEPFEVAEATRKSGNTPLYAWLIILAVACGAVALGFAWLRRRASST